MYKAYFTDGTTYDGGRIQEPKWSIMPDKPISKVEFSLIKRKIVFRDFHAYNFIPIKAQALNAKFTCYCELVFMGRFHGKVYKVTIDLIKGEIRQEKASFGKEYNGGSTSGWKKGVSKMKPSISLSKDG